MNMSASARHRLDVRIVQGFEEARYFFVGIETDGHRTLSRRRPLQAYAAVEVFPDVLEYAIVLVRKVLDGLLRLLCPAIHYPADLFLETADGKPLLDGEVAEQLLNMGILER